MASGGVQKPKICCIPAPSFLFLEMSSPYFVCPIYLHFHCFTINFEFWSSISANEKDKKGTKCLTASQTSQSLTPFHLNPEPKEVVPVPYPNIQDFPNGPPAKLVIEIAKILSKPWQEIAKIILTICKEQTRFNPNNPRKELLNQFPLVCTLRKTLLS